MSFDSTAVRKKLLPVPEQMEIQRSLPARIQQRHALRTEEWLMRAGSANLVVGNIFQALQDFSELVEKYPSSEAYARLGNVHVIRKSYDKAMFCFTQALGLDPENPFALSKRGDLYRLLALSELDDTNRKLFRQRALEDLKEAIRLAKELPVPRVSVAACAGHMLAQYYIDEMDFEKALEMLNESLELSPDDAWSLVRRGDLYRYFGVFDRALADLNRALEIDPEYAEGLSVRGEVHHHMGELDKSLQDLNRAIELKPEKSDYLNKRAQVLHAQGNIDQAQRDLQLSGKLNPIDKTLSQVARKV